MSATPDAWHEAGHALAAHDLGGYVQEVTLESELDGHTGHTAVTWPLADEREEARRAIVVALAGPVAELVFRGEELLDDPSAWSAWRGDWSEAEAGLARWHADAHEREELQKRVLRELSERFDEQPGYERLARVADALEAHGTLDRGLFEEALGLSDGDARA